MAKKIKQSIPNIDEIIHEHNKLMVELAERQRILGQQQIIIELLKSGQKVNLTDEQYKRLTGLK